MTYEEFEREMRSQIQRREEFDARWEAKIAALRAQHTEFEAGMAEIWEMLRQVTESQARFENSMGQIRKRESAG